MRVAEGPTAGVRAGVTRLGDGDAVRGARVGSLEPPVMLRFALPAFRH